ncbi:hypothetical protein C2869_19155 [Saccharobesus litoralis]|uniref:DUF2726 domain-containing protein n=1 Tax=Saccharobesus litoralis TaxID=2172099 RepID=A0A2S0VW42_9ALTE|nr:DUF2726 domain-containing protein [Saccharobesus litoralis]AWB68392.1 hypothetical protein C2869_19155 [Saccharobesus litoralis]
MELVITLMIVLLVVSALAIRLTQSETPFPYKRRESLFTNSERAFMVMLERAVGDEFRIVNRVRLTELLDIRQGTKKRVAQAAKLKATGKVLDFVLLDKTNLTPVAAIDLVNAESSTGYKTKQDWYLKGALDTVNLPHIRIKVRNGYKASELRECISAKLGAKNNKLRPLNVRKVKSKGPTRPIRPLVQAHINQAVAQDAQQAAVA